jgi:heptosyltransferase I
MSLKFSTPPKRICLLRLSAIGDVSHVLPTLRVLQNSWPQTEICWVIGKTELALVHDIQGVEFIPFDKKRGFKALFDLHQSLKGRGFDLLLNMQVSPRAALASLCIKAPLKLGYDRRRGKLLHNLLVNHRIAEVKDQHVLDSFLEFPKALGLKVDDIHWDIPIPEGTRQKIAQLIPQDCPYLVINPCSSVRARNYRNWSVESYAQVIDFAAEKFDLLTVLTGGPSAQEIEYAAAIAQRGAAKPLNLVGKTNLKELLAVLKRAVVTIAPDTGPAHLANAVGTPVIGLYATSNPERTGPYLQRELTVNQYPEALKAESGKDVDQVRWGQRVRNPQAMMSISVAAVIEKLAAVLTADAQLPLG